jgi:hypothetical protein
MRGVKLGGSFVRVSLSKSNKGEGGERERERDEGGEVPQQGERERPECEIGRDIVTYEPYMFS